MEKEQMKRKKRGTDARRMDLIVRRVVAAVLAAAAVALAIYAHGIGLTPATLMWEAACGLLLLEALMLSVNLPVSKLLKGLTGVLCVALLVGGFLNHFYARVDGKFIPKYKVLTHLSVSDEYPAHFEQMESLETLDMLGSTVTDFEPIQSLTALERVDLRENYAFTQQEHDALAKAMPGVDIRWSVPVSGAYFDSAQSDVDVSSLQLSAAQLRELFSRYPDKRFTYRVPLFGSRYAQTETELALTNVATNVDALLDALSLLPQVRSVDLRGLPTSAEDVAALCDAYPDIHFMFTCDVPGAAMTTEDERVTVTGGYDDLMAYMAYIDYMPNLVTMDASAIELTEEQADTVLVGANSGKLLYSLSVFGRKASSLDTELNLDGALVPSVEAMEKVLARLPMLKKVSMCDCGLSESQMGQLFDAHPEVKFIWWLEFGHYRLRTDATAFTTALGTNNKYGYDNETFAPIRYCTDLMMLDLGHNHLTSLESFKNLTKLRVLILADNQLTDISDLAGMEDLEYVELFLNDITDFTPLTDKKKLVDLNVFYNPIGGNYDVLKSMTWLQRLWIGGCRLSSDQISDLKHALSKTKINTEGRGSTGKGWRSNPHYDTLKRMYEEQRYIPFD